MEQNEQAVVRKRSVWGLLSKSLDLQDGDFKVQRGKGLGTTDRNNPPCEGPGLRSEATFVVRFMHRKQKRQHGLACRCALSFPFSSSNCCHSQMGSRGSFLLGEVSASQTLG